MILDRWIDAWYRLRSHEAVDKGWDRYLAEPPVFSPEELGRFRAAVADARRALAKLDLSSAGSAEAIDAAVLAAHLSTADLAIDRLRWPERNPLFYVSPALEGLEALELRVDLAEDTRRDALRRRLFGMRPQLEHARAVHEPMDPYRDVVIELLTEAVDHFARQYQPSRVGPDVAAACDDARAAMDQYREELARRDVRPFEPMGGEAYSMLLREEHLVDEPAEQLVERARAVMHEAGERLAGFDDPLERASESPPPDFRRADVLAYYREEMEAVRAFVAERGLLTVPEGDVELHETPEYLRALLPGAFYLPPPAFGATRTGHLFVSPVPKRMGKIQRRFYWLRVRGRRFRNLISHELWPGHHVQLVRAADHPRAIRKYRDDDVMVEGWGLYAESLVEEHGLFTDLPSPAPWRALRMRAARVVVDVGIHTGTMSFEAAVKLMNEALGGGARDWVRAEVRRYAAEPTQALSYLVGREQIFALRDEIRAARGARFDLRAFHDELLSHGSIPVALIRRALLDRR